MHFVSQLITNSFDQVYFKFLIEQKYKTGKQL